MNILIDTCVISEIQRPNPDPRVLATFDDVNSDEIFLSVITIGEIARGIEMLDPGRRRASLEAWQREIEWDHVNQILPVDIDVARLWGEASARLARRGIVLSDADGLIAATARRYELPIMTRNVRHFQHLELQIINPWAN